MLRVGIFPDLLKISKVVPVHVYKKDDNTNLSNYRPISLLPSMSKIFEKVILEQHFTYLEDNNLIHIDINMGLENTTQQNMPPFILSITYTINWI